MVSGVYTNGSISGTVIKDAYLNLYLNNDYYKSLTTSAKKQIQHHVFYNGSFKNNWVVSDIEKQQKRDNWYGNIALLSINDIYKSSTSNTCTNVINLNVNSDCILENYLLDIRFYWLLNPVYNSFGGQLYVNKDGMVSSTASYGKYRIYPTLYLKATSELIGSGTSSDPYKINN